MLEYKKGNIVLQSETRFSDGSFDPHAFRPAVVMLPSDSYAQDTYYLLATSQVKHLLKDPDAYYAMTEEEWREAGFKRPTLIKLDKMHKRQITGQKKGGLPPKIYKGLIRQLKQYKDEHPDPVYEEIRHLL